MSAESPNPLQGDDLANDIVPDALPEHIAPGLTEFAPWHKVRKQFIRERQWNWFIKRLATRFLRSHLQREPLQWSIEEVEPEGAIEIPDDLLVEKPLCCLVIPGQDILDMRSLWKDINELNVWIRYLGFNESHGSAQDGTRIHVANNAVRSLARMHPASQVLHDQFQNVARANTQAYSYLSKYGPFHVINLDLCDSLFPTQSGGMEEYFSALHKLIEYQMRNQTCPWLLFVTTEVAPNEVNGARFEQLCKPTRENCTLHAQFAIELCRLISPGTEAADLSLLDVGNLNAAQIGRLFGVAIGKALLHFGKTATPQWRVEMLTSYYYPINEELDVSMLSLAYQFRPLANPPIDGTNISTAQVQPQSGFDELSLALNIVNRVGGMTDVDAVLRGNAELRQQLLESSADLLESAGYSREGYVEWVAQGEQC